jgi:hypothetical protein
MEGVFTDLSLRSDGSKRAVAFFILNLRNNLTVILSTYDFVVADVAIIIIIIYAFFSHFSCTL